MPIHIQLDIELFSATIFSQNTARTKGIRDGRWIDVSEDEIQTRMKSLKPEAKIKGGLRRKREAELRNEAKRKLTDKLACSLALGP